MRKIIVLNLFTIVFLAFSGTLTLAQDYVVTIKSDTIYGKVRQFGSTTEKYSSTSSKYLQFTPPQGKKRTYKVTEVIAFTINNEVYHTVKYSNYYTFMKLIKPGYLSLYSYEIENQTTWDGRYFVKKDGAFLDIPNLGFKKKVTQFLSDCPGIAVKLESGELGRLDLSKIVEEYNACIGQKTDVQSEKFFANDAWIDLEKAIKELPEFDKKNDALDMTREIIHKFSRQETVPSFLLNGLKEALKDQAAVKEKLALALQKMN